MSWPDGIAFYRRKHGVTWRTTIQNRVYALNQCLDYDSAYPTAKWHNQEVDIGVRDSSHFIPNTARIRLFSLCTFGQIPCIKVLILKQ